MDFRPPVTREDSNSTLVDTLKMQQESNPEDRTAVNTQVEPELDQEKEKTLKTGGEHQHVRQEEDFTIIHWEQDDPNHPLYVFQNCLPWLPQSQVH